MMLAINDKRLPFGDFAFSMASSLRANLAHPNAAGAVAFQLETALSTIDLFLE